MGDRDHGRARGRVARYAFGVPLLLLGLFDLAAGLGAFGPHADAHTWMLLGSGVFGLATTGALLVLSLRQQARMQAGTLHDTLLGLPNRRALMHRIAELDRTDSPWVVLTLDLDGFKQVNDMLGHQAGDDVLVAAGEALLATCPPGVLAARTGGDEFAVLSPGDLLFGQQLGERLRAAMKHAFEVAAPGFGASVSVGVGRLVRPGEAGVDPVSGRPLPAATARGHDGGKDAMAGLVESAAALRAAKEGGGDAVQIYAGPVAADRERRLRLERRLRRAIASGVIETYGQPIVDLAGGRILGFESLARWTDEELGPIPPNEFIAVAEQAGLVVALGEQLLRATLEAASGAGVFAAGMTVSVNVSPLQLRVPGYVELLRHELDRHRLAPEQVVVEITEAILVTEGDPALRALAELNALGVPMAIDDFGTGYSALGYLRRLPVQSLKIDKSLTSSLLSEPKTVAIVEGVIRMAHRMNIRVVMEGIEDELEADSCRAVGADRGQGWLFGRPVPWDQAAALLAGNDEKPHPARAAEDTFAPAARPLPSQRRPHPDAS